MLRLSVNKLSVPILFGLILGLPEAGEYVWHLVRIEFPHPHQIFVIECIVCGLLDSLHGIFEKLRLDTDHRLKDL